MRWKRQKLYSEELVAFLVECCGYVPAEPSIHCHYEAPRNAKPIRKEDMEELDRLNIKRVLGGDKGGNHEKEEESH